MSGAGIYNAQSNSGDWGNGADGYTSNDTYASTGSGNAEHVYTSYGITGSGNIGKVEVIVEWKYPESTNGSLEIYVSWDGGSTWSSAHSVPNRQTEGKDYVDVTEDTTWDWTKLNNSNLQVKIKSIKGPGPGKTWYLDWIPVKITQSIFDDGFETGDFSAWTGTTTSGDATITVVSSQKHHGTYSSESYVPSATKAYNYKTFTGQTTIFVRRYFRLNEAFTNTYATMTLDELYGGASVIFATGIRFIGSGQYQLYRARYYPTTSSGYTNIDLTVGSWHCIEYKFVKDASSGEYRVWWDGSELTDFTETGLDTSGASDADQIRVGVRYNNVGEEHTINSDCVVVADTYIGEEGVGESYSRSALITLNIGQLVTDLLSGVRTSLQSLNVLTLPATIGSFFRRRIQSLSLGVLASSIWTTVRNIVQSLSISEIASRVLIALRGGIQSLSISAIATSEYTPSAQSYERDALATLNIGEISSSLFVGIRNVFQSSTISNIISGIPTYMRETLQTFSISALSSRLFSASRMNLQSLLVDESSTRLLTAYRINPQSITFSTSVVSGLFFSRSLVQPLSLSDLPLRVYIGIRNIQQSLTFSLSYFRLGSLIRESLQSISLSAIATSQYIPFGFYERTALVSLSINVLSSRLLNAIRQLPQSFEIGNLASSAITKVRPVIQSFSISEFVARILTMLRQGQGAFSFSTSASAGYEFYQFDVSVIIRILSFVARLGGTTVTTRYVLQIALALGGIGVVALSIALIAIHKSEENKGEE